MRSSNPALSESTFQSEPRSLDQPMTLRGTVNKTFLLTAIVAVAGAFAWSHCQSSPSSAGLFITAGAIGGLVISLVTIWKKHLSAITAPLYAAAEGLFLGTLSMMMEHMYHGIVLQAVMLTLGTLFGLLAAYQMNLIRATENFRLGLFAATAGIGIVYLVTMVLGFFGVHIPYIHGSGMVGIGFSLFVVVIAALNLVMDFDFIERGAQSGAPKYMEWFAGFGLLVTLVWLYVEILNLLSKLARRD